MKLSWKAFAIVITVEVFLIILTLILKTTNSSSAQGNAKFEAYATCGIVTSVVKNEEDGFEVTFACQNGNSFAFISGDGDWAKGDIVACVMNDNGTENVTDDIVLSARYCGYINGGK